MKGFLQFVACLALVLVVGCGGGGNTTLDSTILYIVDGGNGRIVRVEGITGGNWTSFGSVGVGAGHFANPSGVAFDASHRIYIADTGNNRIVRINDMTGAGWTTYSGAGGTALSGPTGIAVTSGGRIYVTDTGHDRVVAIDDMTGSNWASFGSVGSGADEFDGPTGIAVRTGQILVADTNNFRLVSISNMSGGNWTTYPVTPIQGTGEGEFTNLTCVSIGSDSKVYLCDNGQGVVRIDAIGGANWALKSQGADTYNAELVSANGEVFVGMVSHAGVDEVRRFPTYDATNWVSLGTTGSGVGQFSGITAIAEGP